MPKGQIREEEYEEGEQKNRRVGGVGGRRAAKTTGGVGSSDSGIGPLPSTCYKAIGTYSLSKSSAIAFNYWSSSLARSSLLPRDSASSLIQGFLRAEVISRKVNSSKPDQELTLVSLSSSEFRRVDAVSHAFSSVSGKGQICSIGL